MKNSNPANNDRFLYAVLLVNTAHVSSSWCFLNASRVVKRVKMLFDLHVLWHVCVFIFASFLKLHWFVLLEMFWAVVARLHLSATVWAPTNRKRKACCEEKVNTQHKHTPTVHTNTGTWYLQTEADSNYSSYLFHIFTSSHLNAILFHFIGWK